MILVYLSQIESHRILKGKGGGGRRVRNLQSEKDLLVVQEKLGPKNAAGPE